MRNRLSIMITGPNAPAGPPNIAITKSRPNRANRSNMYACPRATRPAGMSASTMPSGVSARSRVSSGTARSGGDDLRARDQVVQAATGVAEDHEGVDQPVDHAGEGHCGGQHAHAVAQPEDVPCIRAAAVHADDAHTQGRLADRLASPHEQPAVDQQEEPEADRGVDHDGLPAADVAPRVPWREPRDDKKRRKPDAHVDHGGPVA